MEEAWLLQLGVKGHQLIHFDEPPGDLDFMVVLHSLSAVTGMGITRLAQELPGVTNANLQATGLCPLSVACIMLAGHSSASKQDHSQML